MSTPWITISLSDLNSFLAAAQVNAVNSSALGSGQSARFTSVMTAVISGMRTDIESCAQNRLSATALSIPPSLQEHACMFIIESLQGSLPGLKLDDDQRRRIGRMHDDMDLVRTCAKKVETPDDPLTPATVQGNVLPSVTAKTRYFDRCSQDGL